MEKCIAFIWHLEDYTGKETCLCQLRILSGKYNGKYFQAYLTTNIFKFYYWGVTLEEVEIDKNLNIISVSDLDLESMKKYNINIFYALTFNEETSDALGSDGFVYKLNQSIFYNKCRAVYDHIMNEIKTARNFSLRLYTRDGGIFYFVFDKDISPKASGYKYVMNKGYITADKKVLKSMIPATSTNNTNSNEKMTQADVDKMLEEMLDI